MALISTGEAAKRLGVSRQRVVAMIGAGILKATKVGRAFVIDEAALEEPRVKQRPPGRPSGRKPK